MLGEEFDIRTAEGRIEQLGYVLRQERDALRAIYRDAVFCGASPSEIERMDKKQYIDFIYASRSRLQFELNANKNMMHGVAAKIGYAVNGNAKEFKKQIDDIDLIKGIELFEETPKISSALAKTLARIKKQYGIDLTKEAQHG